MSTTHTGSKYPQEAIWRSAEYRFSQVYIRFGKPWRYDEGIMRSISSELMVYRSIWGKQRLETGDLPPHSPIILATQECDEDRRAEAFASLPTLARETMNRPTPPVDTTGFPQWWLDLPSDWLSSKYIIDRQARGVIFDLSDHIIRTVTTNVGRHTVDNGADVQDFLGQLTVLLQRTSNVKEQVWQMSRSLEAILAYEEERFEAVHAESQKVAAVAQRRHEVASGQANTPVPLLVPVPEFEHNDQIDVDD
ncbi:unnamed protein product [Peniophora sp. CBMAI 1063]|nr:unnamed protein product [Peniophora sp. CBMAI 1063]